MQILAVLGIGFTSILVQIIALRQLLTVFSGNELDIGITLSVWLFMVGIGSFLGHRIRFKHAFGVSFLILALLIQLTVLFISLIHPLFGMVSGETVPVSTTLASTFLSLVLICFVIGAQFPLSVAYLNGDASKAYALEATGAFLGGVIFTFILSGRVDSHILALTMSAASALIAALLFGKKRLAGLLILPFILSWGIGYVIEYYADKELQPVQRIESRYGEIAVSGTPDQFNVYSSGRFEFSYPDRRSEEMLAHIPMSLHASPSRILLIGGSPAVAREILKYPVSGVDFVELDPKMIGISLGILSDIDKQRLRDKRLNIHALDARKFVGSSSRKYDLVVLNLPEPATANLNRFYTVEFFGEVKATLNPKGIFALTLPASHGYIGRRMQAASGTVYRSLKTVFANVALSSEEYGGMYASDAPLAFTADELDRRFSERNIITEHFHPFLFRDVFAPLQTTMVLARLEKVTAINSDRRPVAYLFNLMLWADMHGGTLLNRILGMGMKGIVSFFLVVLLIAFAAFWKRKQAVYFGLFTTGYASIAFSLILLLAYQASYGYVYERIGLLVALLMAGAAAGAFRARCLKSGLTQLKLIELSAILLFLAAPLFFRFEFMYYVLTFLCGMVGGAQFALLSRYAEGPERGESAGRLYALDLGGSVFGAFMTVLFFVPMLGIGNALFSLAILKGSSLILLFTLQRHIDR